MDSWFSQLTIVLDGAIHWTARALVWTAFAISSEPKLQESGPATRVVDADIRWAVQVGLWGADERLVLDRSCAQ